MKPKKEMTRVGRGILSTEDQTTSPSIPGVVWVMSSCASSVSDWIRLIDDRLLPCQPRLRCFLSRNFEFEHMPSGFSCAQLVSAIEMPKTHRWSDVEIVLSSLHSKHFDSFHSLPLWRLYVISGFEEKQILFWRFHHSVGDGVSMGAALTVQLADDFGPVNLDRGTSWTALFGLLFWLWWGVLLVFIRWAWMTLFYPRHPPALSNHKALCGVKKIACSLDGIVTVEECKKIGKKGHATVNDVVLTAVSRALHSFYLPASATHLAVAVPYNIRLSNANVLRLGNSFGSISLFLPICPTKESFFESQKKILAATSWAKKLPEAFVGAGVLMVSQLLLPTRLATWLFNWFCSKVKCSISNVRGVDKDLHYNKVLCESMAGFVPPPNGVPFGIAICSYRDQIFVSITSDVAVIDDPERLLALITSELRKAAKDAT